MPYALIYDHVMELSPHTGLIIRRHGNRTSFVFIFLMKEMFDYESIKYGIIHTTSFFLKQKQKQKQKQNKT